MTPDAAVFVFPPELARDWSAQVAPNGRYPESPLHVWDVRIQPYGSGVLFELGLRDTWKKQYEGTIVTLEQVVRRAAVETGTGMYQCVCAAVGPDSALTAGVVGQSVYIAVHGRDAVERLLAGMADSVVFTRHDFTQGAPSPPLATVKVPVRHH